MYMSKLSNIADQMIILIYLLYMTLKLAGICANSHDVHVIIM